MDDAILMSAEVNGVSKRRAQSSSPPRLDAARPRAAQPTAALHRRHPSRGVAAGHVEREAHACQYIAHD
eukprot:5384891-Pleurochrysis_carterae.AAC.2